LQKEKEQLSDQVENITDQNIRLGEIIDRVNEEKEVALSSNLALKATFHDVEIIKEGSEAQQVTSLKHQLYVVQKELGALEKYVTKNY
jgi:hypothetical protein